MDFDKRTILAFLLIGAILILMNTTFYQKLVDPKGYEIRQQRKQQISQPPMPDERTDERPATVADRIDAAVPQTLQDDPPLPRRDLDEQKIVIETSLYHATLTNKGGTIVQWRLLNYPGPDGNPVELFPEEAQGALAVNFNTRQGDSLNTADFILDYSGKEFYQLKEDTAFVSFRLDLGENKYIEKQYVFIDGRYDVQLGIVFNNMDDIVVGKQYIIQMPDGLASTEKNFKDDMMYAKAGTAAGGVVEKGYKTNNKVVKESAEFDWVAVRTKYFAFFLLPDANSLYAEILGQEFPVSRNTKDKWKKYSIQVAFPYLGQNRVQDNFHVYLGPLEYNTLKAYNRAMQDFLDMGWKIIKPFSIGILYAFKWLHQFIPNYGVVLLLFSVLIKLITYPLTQKSNQSMKRMQALQPKLKELQEKFKGDPQKLNQMTMKLYKEEGVNPMGGCFPMLLQMPLLFALFMVFRTTIDLRGEGFFWWITDLSAPDTIFTFPGNFSLPIYGDSVNILPILMGVTMFIQQKMTITDPKQKMMVYFMPIFFTLLFNSFPSGLNLYYALFNLLSIIQQKYLTPKEETSATTAVAPKNVTVKKKK